MKLYTTAKSANGRKPLLLAHLLGIADRVEIVETDVYTGGGRTTAYLNPAGKIPTLIDGDLVLPESNAILAYLAEQHGGARPTPARRAELLRWMFWEASAWQPALSAVLREIVAHRLGVGAPPVRQLHLHDPDTYVGGTVTLTTLTDAEVAGTVDAADGPRRATGSFAAIRCPAVFDPCI